jgi:hypothetical protein
MALEEANYYVTMYIGYHPTGWTWYVNTNRPFGTIVGYNRFETPNEALEELKSFMRYFTPNVLKDGDSIRKYVEKHRPKKDDN